MARICRWYTKSMVRYVRGTQRESTAFGTWFNLFFDLFKEMEKYPDNVFCEPLVVNARTNKRKAESELQREKEAETVGLI